MPPPKEMVIELGGSGVFNAGERVSATLVLTLNINKKIFALKATVRGVGKVYWEETEKTKDENGRKIDKRVPYVKEEIYLEEELLLCGNAEMPAGVHRCDFSFHLPTNLPGTVEHKYGSVSYVATVVMDRVDNLQQTCNVKFIVQPLVNLNLLPAVKEPLMEEVNKDVGICCWSAGPLTVTVSAPYKGFAPGQTVPLAVRVCNESTKEVTGGYLALRKTVMFSVDEPSYKVKTDRSDVAKFPLPAVLPLGTGEFPISIPLPYIPPTLSETIMPTTYELKVKTTVEGIFLRGTSMRIPLVIGTIGISGDWCNAMPCEESTPAQYQWRVNATVNPFAKSPGIGMVPVMLPPV